MTLRMRPAVAAVALALALLAAGAAGFGGPAASQAAVGDCVAATDWGTPRQELAPRVVELVNEHRARLDLVTLTSTKSLTDSALWKSRHMAKYAYFSHNDPAPPVARTVADRLEACAYPSRSYGWGENIAWGYTSAEAVMQAWLNSPGHRANIENASFKAIGIGVAANTTGRLYWTQNFGTYVGSTSPTPSPSPSPSPSPTTTIAFPASATIQTGYHRAGGTSSLAVDDGSSFQVTAASGTTAWYGRIYSVPNTLKSLRVVYRGWNSASCSQTVSLYDWTWGTWRTLDSRSVGTTELEVAASASGTLADYVSGATGNGDVAVRVRCSLYGGSFYAAGDLLKIEYGT